MIKCGAWVNVKCSSVPEGRKINCQNGYLKKNVTEDFELD